MSVLQRALGIVLGVVFFVAVFIFASIVLAVLVALGLAAWIWIAYKSRALRKQAEEEIIEGEFRDVTDLERLEERRRESL